MSTVSWFALGVTPSHAQTAWQGVSPDWHTASNWSLGAVPTGATTVTIGAGSLIAPSITAAGASANLLHIGAIGMTSSLTVSAGGSLTATATTVANLAGEAGSANLMGGAWSG
ncbi:hypothetical protein, partial [Lysobacter sp. TAB13]|uniref:hypothetical protein n=1 Tax=Lysobacter sp. TAB13 TaxID=3233065 RepID=UPI003F9E20BE